MYICIGVSIYASMYVYMYVYMHVCMYTCMYQCTYVCMHACKDVCVYVFMHLYTYNNVTILAVGACVCVCGKLLYISTKAKQVFNQNHSFCNGIVITNNLSFNMFVSLR